MSNNLKKIIASRDLNREANVLSSTIRADGVGEDPAVKALLSEEFTKMNDLDAMQVALAIQQLIRGQSSILENQQLLSENIAKMNARMASYDEDQKKWEANQQKFFDEVMTKAEKNRITDPEDKARLEGSIKEKYQRAVREAAERRAAEHAALKLRVASDPKEIIMSPGVVEMRSTPEGPVPAILPERFTFKTMQWILPPGKAVEVPRFIAEEYRQHKIRQQEAVERREAIKIGEHFDRDNEQSDVNNRMKAIDKKYGITVSE